MLCWNTLWSACGCVLSTAQSARCTCPSTWGGFSSIDKIFAYRSCTAALRTLRWCERKKAVRKSRRTGARHVSTLQWSPRAQECGRICERANRRTPMGAWSRTWELGGVSVVRLIRILPYSTTNGDEGASHASSVWSDGSLEDMSAVHTVRYYTDFVKVNYSPSDAIHFLSDLKLTFLRAASKNTREGPQFGLEDALSDILSAQRDGTVSRAEARRS